MPAVAMSTGIDCLSTVALSASVSVSNLPRREPVSAVVVSFSDPAATRQAIESLLRQSVPPIEVLVLDNHPAGMLVGELPGWGLGPCVRLIHSGENLGYAVACNRGAAQADGDWIFFLNPDASAEVDCLRTLLDAADPAAGALGAQILLPDGRTNAGDNPLHVTGAGWSGRYGEPREHGPPRAAAAVSGAALLARRGAYRQIGGMCERFFLYYDDTDLCWRLRLAGWDVKFCPEALVWHDYAFVKGTSKWYWLERNRLWSVLSNYSPVTLVLLLPLLVASELIVAALAARDGWLTALVRAWGSTLKSVPELRAWRRQVQATRRCSDSEILERMVGRVQTQLLEGFVGRRSGALVELYRRVVLSVLRTVGH
jgi:GT2 family glycosyltransferase